MTNRKTVKAWFALTSRDGVHSVFLRIQWLKFQHLNIVMNQSLVFLLWFSELRIFSVCLGDQSLFHL